MSDVLKTPAEWEPICNVKVFDPDGWDRSNYDKSWSEPITEAEFRRRANQSTCAPFDAYQKMWGQPQRSAHAAPEDEPLAAG